MLDTPARPRGTRNDREDNTAAPRRGVVVPSYRRDLPEDFLDFERMPFDGDQNPRRGRRGRSWRLRLARMVPRSWLGKAALGLGVLVGAAALAFGWYEARVALLHDARFVIPSSDAIELAGNSHLSRAQLLSVFGDDVDRNVWRVPLEQRRATLEALPWVEHATVMRLLPNRLRVAVTERTPVAFVRDGGNIGLVDGSGVILEFQPGQSMTDYSFPVVTGVSAGNPLSTRSAQMKLFLRFTQELDAGALKGQEPTRQLSEVDLTDPEDITATYEEHGRSILIHLGDHDFLKRWRNFTENLAEWEKQYPKLGSADLRYDPQVVLRMAAAPPAAAGATTGDAKPPAPAASKAASPKIGTAKLVPAKGLAAKVARLSKGSGKAPGKVPSKARTTPAKRTQKKGAQP